MSPIKQFIPILILIFISLFFTQSVLAVDMTVMNGGSDTTNGNGCSLIEAITNANDDAQTYADCPAGSGTDTINLATDVTLTARDNFELIWAGGVQREVSNGLPMISTTIVIEAADHTIQRDPSFTCTDTQNTTQDFRLFMISGTIADLTINEATLKNGCLNAPGASDGAGIFVAENARLTITNSSLTNHSAVGFLGQGGAIDTKGDTSISNSTISHNFADYVGGGIYADDGRLILENSRVGENESGGFGGGIAFGYGDFFVLNSTLDHNIGYYGGATIILGSLVRVVNSTLSYNHGYQGGAIYDGGGLYMVNSTLSHNEASHATEAGAEGAGIYRDVDAIQNSFIFNTIIANSLAGGNCGGDSASFSGGNNVADDATCPSNRFTNNATLDLGALADNGGPTPTHSISINSAALNAGGELGLQEYIFSVDLNGDGDTNDDLASGFDQRGSGFNRTTQTLVDAGAYELQDPCATLTFPYTATTAGTLIAAIECANANSTKDTIYLDGGTTYLLDQVYSSSTGGVGLPFITSPIVIEGNGATIQRDSFDRFRIFYVTSSGDLTLNSVTIRGGSVIGGSLVLYPGGGLLNEGTVIISNSTIRNNTAEHVGGNGLGGGIVNSGGATLTIVNSTISNNSAVGSSGLGGGIFNSGDMALINSTISNNTGSGLYSNGAAIDIYNSIVAASSGDNCTLNSGTIGANNLTDDATCIYGGFTQSASINLDVLADNGGSTETHALLAGSSAIDAGDNQWLNESVVGVDLNGDGDQLDDPISLYDQRGIPFFRINDSSVDVGAYETGVGNVCSVISFPFTATVAQTLLFAIDCANDNGTSTDTINLDPNSTYTLTEIAEVVDGNNGLPSVTTPIIINGNGSTIERSSAITETFRIFHVASTGNLVLDDFTLQGGDISGTGGGLYNLGTTTITNGHIRGNQSSGSGGGLYNDGTLTLTNSLVTGNKSINAGQIGGGIINYDLLTLNNVTISGNQAYTGGGVGNWDTVIFRNSILWGNVGTFSNPQFFNDNAVTIGIDTGVEGGFSSATNLSSSADIFVNPISASLAPTSDGDYHLTDTSDVINLANNSLIPAGITTDYDGNPRIINGIVDMGAYESLVGATNITINNASGFEGNIGTTNLDFTITLNPSIPVTVSVDVTTIPEIAQSPEDFTAISTTVDIPPNSVSFTVAVVLHGDITPEAYESFRIELSNPVNGVLVNATATGFIQNDDALPPENENLIYNPSFTLGANKDAGWRFDGSILHQVTGGVMNLSFPSTVDGWMRQFRSAYPLQQGLGMEATIDVQNPDNVTKTVRLIVRDSDLTNNYQCVFTIPPKAPLRTYTMRFLTGTDWAIIRFDVRPDVADTNGLKFDNMNLQYRPSLGITGKVCLPPTLPPLPAEDTNLIFNPNFTFGGDGENGWQDIASMVSTQIDPGTGINISFPTTVDGWLRQYRLNNALRAGLKMVAWVNVSNPDPVTKTFQLMLRDNDLTNTYLCSFEVPANAPTRNYYMRFITATDWEIIRVDMRPQSTGDLGLNVDDVNLRYRPYLAFTATLQCIPPNFSDEAPPPPPTELVLTNNTVGDAFNATRTENQSADMPLHVPTTCQSLDWFNTNNWTGYLPTSEVQFVFDPFPTDLTVGDAFDATRTFDANGDGVADTLYDALSYNGHGHAVSLLHEAVIAMLNDRYDSNQPESWWAVEIDTAEALAQGDNAMLALAQQYALSNATCH